MKRALVLLLFAVAATAAEPVKVGVFSAGDLDGWESKTFRGATTYALTESEGRRVLRADSRAAASGMYKRVHIDLEQTPYLRWSWRVTRTFGQLDETQKRGDDYPARVYVVFSGGVFFWNTRALNYVWASAQPQGAIWPNAYTGNAQMLAVRSGNARVGEWVEERRNVRADFQRLFGRDVRYVDAVALMTDTDDTGESAIAYYGDIYFSAD